VAKSTTLDANTRIHEMFHIKTY